MTFDFEKHQTTYPKALANVLIKLPEFTWRKLRAEMRWKYARWDLVPPPILRDYMSLLWDDAQEWVVLCKHVNNARQAQRQATRRMRQKKDIERERRHRRDYMRVYMANYRKHPKRRGST